MFVDEYRMYVSLLSIENVKEKNMIRNDVVMIKRVLMYKTTCYALMKNLNLPAEVKSQLKYL